jgi:hypothetical protein
MPFHYIVPSPSTALSFSKNSLKLKIFTFLLGQRIMVNSRKCKDKKRTKKCKKLLENKKCKKKKVWKKCLKTCGKCDDSGTPISGQTKEVHDH